jgi:predicted metal-binding membrane protein
MWPHVRDRGVFPVAFGALVALAWLSLWLWERSPSGRFLSHEQVGEVHGLGGEYLTVVVLFVAGWTLMTVAMMLPTSLPLVALFHSLVRERQNQTQLVVLLVLGYLSVWLLFGAAAHLGDRGLHEAVERSGWLADNEWLISASTILLAGAYQFSSVKHRSLGKCRSPFSFIGHRCEGHGSAQAFRIGVHHGIFCLGCSWALMLLMFVAGVGNLGFMLALGAVMAVEKNARWGRHLTAPLGAGLLAFGASLVVLEIM